MVDENSSGPVDPHQLLKALSPLLNSDGGAKGIPEVVRITNLMKESSKLVSRCVYISVLRSTKDEEVLQKFIKQGGWDVLNAWLQENKTEDCYAFLLELLKLYERLPVTIDLLKKNNCAKTVKQLSKAEDERIKTLSTDIVTLWMDKIKSKSGEESKASDSLKHKHKHHHHHKDKHKDKSSSSSHKDSSKEHHKKPSPHKEHSHHHHRRDSETPNDPTDKAVVTSKPHRLSQDDVQGEKQKSKSSAKVAPHKFRSTGLEQENVLPPSKKKKSLDKSATKRSSSGNLAANSQPPEKKTKQSANSTSDTTVVSPSGKANIHLVTEEETHGKIKLIPPKPKPPPKEVYESSGFMDAITTTYVPTLKLKKKKLGGVTAKKGPTSPTSPPTPGATSPNGKDRPAMPSFYKDTLEMPTSPVEDDSSEKSSNKDTDSKNGDVKDEEGKDEDAKSVVSDISSESSKKKKKKVSWAAEKDLKSFFYFELDETERVNVNKIKSFEDIKKHETMMERQAIENAKKLHDSNSKERTQPGCIPWRLPVLVTGHNIQNNVVPGCNSTEIETQRLREEGVLQALFFSKHMIPDSAKEPDPEEVEYAEPKNIPLEDESGGGEAFMDYTNYPVPQPVSAQTSSSSHHHHHHHSSQPSQSKQQSKSPHQANQQQYHQHPQDKHPGSGGSSGSGSQFSLPPDIANMLSSMANHYQDPKAGSNQSLSKDGGNPGSQTGSGGSDAGQVSNGDITQGLPPDMQNILKSIVGNNQSGGEEDEWYKQMKKMVEPYKDQIKDMLQQQQPFSQEGDTSNNPNNNSNSGGNMNNYPHGYPPPLPPLPPGMAGNGEALLGNGPGMPYGMPPPPPHPNFMRGPPPPMPPPPPMMGYGPRPGGPMFRGRGPRPPMGGPMRGGRGGHMRPQGKSAVCRNFLRGKCQRGKNCNYYHPQQSNNS